MVVITIMWHCNRGCVKRFGSTPDSLEGDYGRQIPPRRAKQSGSCGYTGGSDILYDDGRNVNEVSARSLRQGSDLMAHAHTPQQAPTPLPSPASAEQATLIGTLVHLWPFIWPGDRVDLKMRVVWSVVLLLVAKLATLAVPFTFKWATD